MNKSDLIPTMKKITEMDKQYVENDQNLSKEQKEALKQFFDKCYEDFEKYG